ncbi:MaoC family dehydratase [Massilia cavernae]|uniref:MaoC family dehydratase n=1 Tax=Massilia cavernae TaxID=2320864 RepID=A0A418Y798_9BURK|nr:MaoC family dehydratase [Massilia cavernae]RJG25813.1 MaoC family dehydratase [Massilia cavernae]
MSGKRMCFEDFFPGQQLELGSRTLSEQEIIAFAKDFDPQPFHVDHEAAKDSIFGGVVASGWHTCSTIMRIVVDSVIGNSTSLGSPGVDKIRWMLPVRPGDTLSVRYVTTQVKASASRPDRGVVWSTWEARNQNGELVCTIEGMGMYGRRPVDAGDS